MKKFLSLLLCLAMLLSAAACSSSLAEEEAKTEPAPSETVTEESTAAETIDNSPITLPEGFAVGFGRATINPANGTGLGGYGTQNTRLSTRILDDLMLTCTAISDGENVVFIFSSDTGQVGGGITRKVAEIISKTYDFPQENVFVNATHSHSTPALVNTGAPGMPKYANLYYETAKRIAGEALRDLESAEIYVGRGETDGLSYVRRYVNKVTGEYAGKNHNFGLDANVYAHETEADEEMQIIKFDRATKKDVVLCNWQCHPTGPGGSTNTDVSADWIGTLRSSVEKDNDVLFSYHQGAAGNIAQSSYVAGGNNNSDWRQHGINIGKTATAILQGEMTKMASGKVQVKKSTYQAEYRPEIQNGTMKRVYSNSLSVTAISIGDVAFGTLPVELHDTMGMIIKHTSSFPFTFYCGYSNGASGYIPDSPAWNNGGYEVEETHFSRGTGEAVAAYVVSEINSLYPTRF